MYLHACYKAYMVRWIRQGRVRLQDRLDRALAGRQGLRIHRVDRDDRALQRKVWLITGTYSGFGKHLVTSVLARGDSLIATVYNIEKLRAVFPTHNDHLHLLDIADSKKLTAQRIKATIATWGRIDVVVNNASYPLRDGRYHRTSLSMAF
ncbi:hypothetical protein V8D89_000942 [Ganoderma adspersum]